MTGEVDNNNIHFCFDFALLYRMAKNKVLNGRINVTLIQLFVPQFCLFVLLIRDQHVIKVECGWGWMDRKVKVIVNCDLHLTVNRP